MFSNHEKIFIGKPVVSDLGQITKELEILKAMLLKENTDLIRVIVQKLVPGYKKVGKLDSWTVGQEELGIF